MNTCRYTPEIVVASDLTFSIPLYQRLFTWGDEQVEGLLFDLQNHFSDSDSAESPYYLGLLSCIEMDGSYDLIDGQQRFTVMMLMAIVLRDYYDSWNDFLADGKRLHFISRSKDNEYLKALISGLAGSEVNLQMERGIASIRRFIANEESFPDDEARKWFAENVYKRMSFFFSVLPDSYTKDPSSLNKYFEAMNARGKGLEQHEILKVQLMRNMPNKEDLTRIWNAVSDMDKPIIKRLENESDEDYRTKYRNTIALCRKGAFQGALQSCESSYDAESDIEIGDISAEPVKFNHEYSDTGSRSIISFPEFLIMVLDIQQNLDGSYALYRSELLNLFRKHSIPADRIQDFYQQMFFYRLLFDFYIVHKEENELANRYSIICKAGATTKALVQYQSMLYVSQTPFYKWIKPVLKALHDGDISSDDLLLDLIKRIDNALRKLPLSADLMSYDQNVDRYWFWRLDYYLWEQRDVYFKDDEAVDREIVESYVFRTNRSLEHLHPQDQGQNSEWPAEDVHSFGNLAMISQGFNSQQSNDPVDVKFARILNQANNYALQSIKLYRMYLDAKKDPSGWTVDVKRRHQEEMYELLRQSFEG